MSNYANRMYTDQLSCDARNATATYRTEGDHRNAMTPPHSYDSLRFYCPVKDLSRVPEGNRLTPKLLLELAPDVGLIIDLTDTTRYYKPQWFLENGIEYTKLAIAGHILPPKQKHNA